MRTVVTLCCLLVSVILHAQEQVEGFWGVPFYSSKSMAIANVKANKGLEPSYNQGNKVTYMGATFGGEISEGIVLNFYEDNFCRGIVSFEYDGVAILLQHYYDWKKKLIAKYGKPVSSNEKWPYYADDYVMKQVALQKGEAKLSGLWVTKNKLTGKAVCIVLGVSGATTILYSMYDVALDGRRGDAQEAEEKKDY
ncbi:MAG: hypothetical protein JST82_01345 [Bacteroidetes bacterium]|nr:hypothetical protein [Bacteroidota bacterium]